MTLSVLLLQGISIVYTELGVHNLDLKEVRKNIYLLKEVVNQ